MQNTPLITVDALREKLSSGEAVNIIDIRPQHERAEWFIPGSIHMDVYEQVKNNDATAFESLQLDPSVDVVTVCAGGRVSVKAAEMLTQKGYNAYSLLNGMKGWSQAWNTAHHAFNDLELWQLRRTGKGCLSYVIASGKEAIIVDASLPLEVYAGLVDQHRLMVKYVIETHIHADHLSRSKELAKYFHVPLHLPAPNKVKFEHEPIKAGMIFSIGSVKLQSMPTPGHTLESFSFYIDKRIILTGDTLFTNGVGRPDLKASEEECRAKAALLFESLHKLLSLPGTMMVLPAHTDKPADFDNILIKTTLAEAKCDISFLKYDKEEFIESILQKIPPTPPNFISIAEKNLTGNYEGIDPIDLEAGANRCTVS